MSVYSISPPQAIAPFSMRPPGSKSHTIRALFMAAAAEGLSHVAHGLEARDTEAAIRCLRGFGIGVKVDSGGPWEIEGQAGEYKTPEDELLVGESGLTARFAMALAPFVPGSFVIRGSGRLPQRPMGGLLEALRKEGVTVSESHPWRLAGGAGFVSREVKVDASESSQVVSALLHVMPHGGGNTTLRPVGLSGSNRYIDLTRRVMDAFGVATSWEDQAFTVHSGLYRATDYDVPVDASAAVYPAVAAAITAKEGRIIGDMAGHPDLLIFEALERMGCEVTREAESTVVKGPAVLSPIDMDMSEAPDAALGLAIACARADGTSSIGGLGSLRFKESDRLHALESELSRYGSHVVVDGDTLRIRPGRVRREELWSHGDHRMAMSLSLLGLCDDGVLIRDPGVVAKTWPGYWDWFRDLGPTVSPV